MIKTSDLKQSPYFPPKRIIYTRIHTCQLGSVMSVEIYSTRVCTDGGNY